MQPLRNEQDIFEYENQTGLVAVYLDNGYNPEITEIMSSVGHIFGEHVGSAWHILNPVKDMESGRPAYMPSVFGDLLEYNSKLARQIAQNEGIDTKRLPALVFQFVRGNPKGHYAAILKGMSSQEIRDLLNEIGEIAVSEMSRYAESPEEGREAVHRAIIPLLEKRRILHISKRAIAFVCTALGAIAATVTIRG